MVEVNYEITKEQYDRAKSESAYVLIGDSIKMGYGAYGAEVYEAGGKYYLTYSRGSSAD